jgi:hypothetical protein
VEYFQDPVAGSYHGLFPVANQYRFLVIAGWEIQGQNWPVEALMNGELPSAGEVAGRSPQFPEGEGTGQLLPLVGGLYENMSNL